GGDPEGGIVDVVVEHGRIGAVEGRARGGRTAAGGRRAVGRQNRADLQVARLVVVDAAADDQVAREEERKERPMIPTLIPVIAASAEVIGSGIQACRERHGTGRGNQGYAAGSMNGCSCCLWGHEESLLPGKIERFNRTVRVAASTAAERCPCHVT